MVAGKYEILELIGSGGMGTVWRAHSLSLDVDVAIKVLRRDQGVDEVAAERLLREARATASIGHPAIVRALDFGAMESGEPFLVMELLEGSSLADWLDRGRISAAHAVQLLLPIADGLCAAHACGIVHRDIKPENILVVPVRPGIYLPKIVDFGIAKMDRAEGGQVLTQKGTVLGSLQYMPPEQAYGQRVGEQADIWSLCVVLYELITGRCPFEGQTLAAMLVAIHSRPPVPIDRLAAGDEELWAILERGLKKPLEERWPTMRALGRALAAWALERGITTDATGASIEHVWLDRGSEAFGTGAPVRASRPGGAPISPRAASICATQPSPTGKTPPAPSSGREAAETPGSYLTSVRTVPAPGPSPRLGRGRLMGAVAALAVVPLLAVVGLCSHSTAAASTVVGASLEHDAGPSLLVGAVEARPMTTFTSTSARAGAGIAELAPAPPPPPPPPVAVTASRSATSEVRQPSGGRPRPPACRSKTGAAAMPIPTTPDF